MQTNHQREISNLERKHEVSECIIRDFQIQRRDGDKNVA